MAFVVVATLWNVLHTLGFQSWSNAASHGTYVQVSAAGVGAALVREIVIFAIGATAWILARRPTDREDTLRNLRQ